MDIFVLFDYLSGNMNFGYLMYQYVIWYMMHRNWHDMIYGHNNNADPNYKYMGWENQVAELFVLEVHIVIGCVYESGTDYWKVTYWCWLF